MAARIADPLLHKNSHLSSPPTGIERSDQLGTSATTNQQLPKKATADPRRHFSCVKCPERSFRTKWNAEKHRRSVHEKERSFMCSLCDHRCSAKSNLKRHVRDVHEKLRQHRCTWCAQTFAQRATLKRHLAKKHNRIVDDNAHASYRLKGADAHNPERDDTAREKSKLSLPSSRSQDFQYADDLAISNEAENGSSPMAVNAFERLDNRSSAYEFSNNTSGVLHEAFNNPELPSSALTDSHSAQAILSRENLEWLGY